MRKAVFYVLLAAAVVTAAIWAWRSFFPNHEQRIRRRLTEVAQAACFSGNEAPLVALQNCKKLASFFTPDLEITVNVRGYSQEKLSGRDELLQKALAARAFAGGLTVEFLDMNVAVEPDKKSAVVNLTGKARRTTESDLMVQELKLTLKRVEGKWLIHRIETVKTLSQLWFQREALGRAA